jgi:rubrerythrin
MTKTPVAILVLGLLAAGPVWSQPLTKDAETALGAALQDERHAEAFYDAVLNKFSGARPFSNIIEAERQHQKMLLGLYETYGIAVPNND